MIEQQQQKRTQAPLGTKMQRVKRIHKSHESLEASAALHELVEP